MRTTTAVNAFLLVLQKSFQRVVLLTLHLLYPQGKGVFCSTLSRKLNIG